jgi:hypothetical protein
MSDSTPTIGDPQDEFSLPSRSDLSLRELIDEGGFDDVHFFLNEAVDQDELTIEATDEDVEFALIPYSHAENAIDDDTFDLVDEAGYEYATLRDLLNLAIDRPNIQREYEVIALGTMRTRRVFKDRTGETVWDQKELDKSICQWVTGLSNLKERRTLVPVELFLDKVLRKDTLLLVRKTQ